VHISAWQTSWPPDRALRYIITRYIYKTQCEQLKPSIGVNSHTVAFFFYRSGKVMFDGFETAAGE
jgi:hypothetical protein